MNYSELPTSDDMRRVVDRASEMSGIPAKVLLGRKSSPKVAHWRWAIFYVLRNKHFTWLDIAGFFNRNHSTVINGCNMIENSLHKLNIQRIVKMLAAA